MPRQAQKGQISILIIFSLIPMFTLFAFVVNVGMLVNAKIALQNAADLAAYAGAATQARQMTHISYVNYQMRQAYKKFLFKYYVMGNMSLKCFPRGGSPGTGCPAGGGGASPFNWINVDNQGNSFNKFPSVPIVCLSLSTESNPCQLARPSVPVVQKPQCIPIDPTCSILQNAAEGIAQIQLKACSADSQINSEVLINWLYATEFNSQLKENVALQGLIEGIGLVPEELIHKGRIDTLQGYVNEPAKTVSPATIRKLEENPEPPKMERTLLAFKTAQGNLNVSVFDEDSIEMKELLQLNPLQLKPIRPEFEAAYGFMDGDVTDPSKGCQMKLEFISAKPYVGVYKSTQELVYYAIKLTAKAKLLFNPFPFGSPSDSIELTAYSAAMPFGSRIGPKLDESAWVRPDGMANEDATGPKRPMKYPRLPIDATHTWESEDVLAAYFNVMKSTEASGGAGGSAVAGGALGKKDLDRGLRAAQIPDEFEIGRYNIPVDTDTFGVDKAKEMVAFYRTAIQSSLDTPFTFWAPVFGIGAGTRFNDELKEEMANIGLSIAKSFNCTTSTCKARETLQKELLAKANGMLGALRNTSFDQPGFNVARMPDPFALAFFKTNAPPPNVPGKVQDNKAVATSYTTDHDSSKFQNGREGYSVKYIPFQLLYRSANKISNIDGSEANWKALLENFSGEREELIKVAH